MKTVSVLYGQELIDIVIQELGDATRLIEVALLNGIGPTDTISAGSSLIVPDYDATKKKIVRAFSNGFKPASSTGISATGFWNFSPVISSNIINVATGQKGVRVEEGQELIDIVVQELGDATRLIEVALLNGIGATDIINAGDYIIVPAYAQDKKDIVKVFTNPMNKPASGKQNDSVNSSLLDGIDYWAVNVDFVVS